MTWPTLRYCLWLPLLLSPLVLDGCAFNPATGNLDFMLVSPQEEKEIGQETHPKVLIEFGGAYHDPALASYVEKVGKQVAAVTELQDFEYLFTILDSPAVNAFALPGGYIYVTRGLLALAGSEAELASVLSHELAHVNARHGAQRLSGMKAQERLCATFACGYDVPVLKDMTETGVKLAFGGFTQDQEFEADKVGLRYLAEAGYDQGAMTSFLRKLKAQRDLEARAAGLSDAQRDTHGYSSTHPLTEERIERATALLGDPGAPSGRVGDREYLTVVDGLLYGNRREFGFVIGRRFAHPIKRITFTAPPGYTLYTDSRRVTSLGPGGAIILFEPSRKLVPGQVVDYLTGVWADGTELDDVRAFEINGMEAATGWMRRQTERGLIDYRLVAVREEAGVIYRFLFIVPARMSERLAEGMRRTTYSFRMLGEEEAAALHPRRLRIVKAGPNDDALTMQELNDYFDNAAERFAILNGLGDPPVIDPGRLIKIVKN